MNREECLQEAADRAAVGYQVLFFAPLEEAARRAHRPGGPSLAELRDRIASWRRAHTVPLP